MLFSLLGLTDLAKVSAQPKDAPAEAGRLRMPKKRLRLPEKIRDEDDLELADGRKIKAARLREFGDRLQAFAEERGIDLQDGRDGEVEIPLHPEQRKRVDASDAGFQVRLKKLREQKAAGWKDKIRKRVARFDADRPPFKTLRKIQAEQPSDPAKK